MTNWLKQIINKNRVVAIIAIVLTALVISCVTVYETISNRNFADQYNPTERKLHPEYAVYQRSANDIRLYFRFFPKELWFVIPEGDSIKKAHASLFFRITNSYTGTRIIDSMTTNFNMKGNPRPQFLGYVSLKIPDDGKYVIEVFLTDLNARQTVSTVIDYEKKTGGNASGFMFISQYGNPLFYPYCSVNDTFRVRSEMFSSKQLLVSYYKPDRELPEPPDVPQTILLEPQPVDSTWKVANRDTALFSFKKEGIYFFANSGGIIGKPFVCSNTYFPYQKTPEVLLRPLAYLCTPKEMKHLEAFESPKQAVDSFWIKTTNDLDKARELIRIFYNRVQLTNYYFTDYKEGWLTDRGMIFLICGAPSVITKTDEGEYWKYGKGNDETTKFFFYREAHPVFGTTYILERSDLYSRMWYNAISTWRDGRVFSLTPQ